MSDQSNHAHGRATAVIFDEFARTIPVTWDVKMILKITVPRVGFVLTPRDVRDNVTDLVGECNESFLR